MKKLLSLMMATMALSFVFTGNVKAEELNNSDEIIEEAVENDTKVEFRVLDINAVFEDEIVEDGFISISVNEVSDDAYFEPEDNDLDSDDESSYNPYSDDENYNPYEDSVKSTKKKKTVAGIKTLDIPAYDDEDIELLAKLIWHEAEGEPRAGKIAVGEVVVNRIKSRMFPNNVYAVTYQPGQFSDNEYIEGEKPNKETYEIADDVLNHGLKVFSNSDILYFRNTMKTSNVPTSVPMNWGRHRYATYIGNHAFYFHGSKDESGLFARDTIAEYSNKKSTKIKSKDDETEKVSKNESSEELDENDSDSSTTTLKNSEKETENSDVETLEENYNPFEDEYNPYSE